MDKPSQSDREVLSSAAVQSQFAGCFPRSREVVPEAQAARRQLRQEPDSVDQARCSADSSPPEITSTGSALLEMKEGRKSLGLCASEPCSGLSSVSDMSSHPTGEATSTSSPCASASTSFPIPPLAPQFLPGFSNQALLKSDSFSVAEFVGSVRREMCAGDTYSDAFERTAQGSSLCAADGMAGSGVYKPPCSHVVSSSVDTTSPSVDREATPSTFPACFPYYKSFLESMGTPGLSPGVQGDSQDKSSLGVARGATWLPQLDLNIPRAQPVSSSSQSPESSTAGEPQVPVCDTTSGLTRFSCDICHKGFRQQASLLVHMRVHSGDRPYQCNTCNKTFNQAANLIAHQRTHTGERPYECLECGKRFTQQGNLMIHKRTHSKEKPFECDVCHKSFSQAGNLKTHQRIHLGLRPYHCPHCSMDFTQLSGLQSHQRSKHGISEPSKRRESASTPDRLTSVDCVGFPDSSQSQAAAQVVPVREATPLPQQAQLP